MSWLESLIALVILFALIASWTLWTSAFLQWRNGKQILPAEPRRNVPWGVFDLIGALASLIAFQIGAMAILSKTTNLFPSTKLEELSDEGRVAVLVVGAVSSLAALGVAFLLAKLRAGATWSDLGVSTRAAPFDIVLGLAGYFMLAPLVFLVMLILVQWFPSEHPLVKLVKENPDPRFFVLSAVSAVLVAPIVEEFLFRVLLQGWLEALAVRIRDRYPPEAVVTVPWQPEETKALPPLATASPDPNPYAPPEAVIEKPVVVADSPTVRPPPTWPIFVSSIVFALLHWGHGPDPIPLFVLALGLGYMYRQTHRVLPCIVVHMLLNAVSMLVLLLNVYAGMGK